MHAGRHGFTTSLHVWGDLASSLGDLASSDGFGQNHLARHSEKGEEDKADRGRGGKTTSGNGQA